MGASYLRSNLLQADSPGFKFRWRLDFPHRSTAAHSWGVGGGGGVKRRGCGADRPLPSSSKEWVGAIYISFHFVPSYTFPWSDL